jgi:outer membrane protein assembly factor BamB
MNTSASTTFAVLACMLSLVGCAHKFKEAGTLEGLPSVKNTKRSSDLVIDPNKFPDEAKMPFVLEGGFARWSKFSIGGEISSPPVVGKDMFFVLTKDCSVKAYKVKNRELVWSTPISTVSNASMLLHRDKLYVAAGACLTAFSASEGKQVFYSKLQAPISSGLCLHNEMCYLQTAQGLHAINTETGVATTESLPCDVNSLSRVSPIIYKNKIVFTSCVGHIAILDSGVAKGFPRLIRFASGANSPPITSSLVSQPLLNKQYCYFATSHGALQKCDLEKETAVWSLEVPVIQSISLVNNTILVATEAGQIMAITAKTGRVIWISNLKVNGSDEFLPPFMPREALHAALNVFSIISTSLMVAGTTQFINPPIVENPVVVISKSGKVFTLHPDTGGILRTTKLPCEDRIISAAVSGSRLMLFGEKGSVLKNR